MKSVINKEYFKGEIYVSHAKASITSDVTGVESDLQGFIDEYVEDCIFKCFGLELGIEFRSKLDSSKENGLIDGAEDKWNWLLNGRETYVDVNGKTKRFKGIRWKSSTEEGAVYDKSLLAYYVYFFYESNKFISTTGIGQSIPKAKNAEVVNPSFKATKAWRKFFQAVNGNTPKKSVINTNYGYGVDYFNKNNYDVSLYDFIKDMNAIDETTYENFEENNWGNINQFGI
jgi:hypothetical protein